MVGVGLTVSATATILALIEHELPEHELVTLLDLRRENLEIVEFAIDDRSPAAGRFVRDLNLPSKSRLISVTRDGRAEIAIGDTELRPGDLVMAILEPGAEDDLKRVLMPVPRRRGSDVPGADRALPRPAAGERGDSGRDAGRGLHAAARGAASVSERTGCRVLPEVRGREPDRLVQGPGDDDGGLEGARGGRARGRVRLDGQHVGIGGRVLRPRRACGSWWCCPRARSRAASSPRPRSPGARVIAVQGDFDDALGLVRELVSRRDMALLNSVNPYRLEGQKTAAFEVVEQLGGVPDWLALPGRERRQHHRVLEGVRRDRRRAAHARRPGRRAPRRCSPASRWRIPRRWRRRSGSATRPGSTRRSRRSRSRPAACGRCPTTTILAAYRLLAQEEGVFCEPASAASVGALLGRGRRRAGRARRDGRLRADRARPEGSRHRRAPRAPRSCAARRRSTASRSWPSPARRSLPDRLTRHRPGVVGQSGAGVRLPGGGPRAAQRDRRAEGRRGGDERERRR